MNSNIDNLATYFWQHKKFTSLYTSINGPLSLNLHQANWSKINSAKKKRKKELWGYSPGPLAIYSDALPTALSWHVLLGRSLTEVCFMHHFLFWIISRIICTWFIDSDWQPNVNWAQSWRHQGRSRDVLGSIPTGDIFTGFNLLQFVWCKFRFTM